jgi:hypothetical protein
MPIAVPNKCPVFAMCGLFGGVSAVYLFSACRDRIGGAFALAPCGGAALLVTYPEFIYAAALRVRPCPRLAVSAVYCVLCRLNGGVASCKFLPPLNSRPRALPTATSPAARRSGSRSIAPASLLTKPVSPSLAAGCRSSNRPDRARRSRQTPGMRVLVSRKSFSVRRADCAR